MSKILVFGKNGQVGWELQRSLGLYGNVVFLGRNDRGGNLLDIDSMDARIKEEAPNIIFNAAAYTAVDAAENDFETARKVNGDAVAAMAAISKEINCLLIHYSTDYVFSGVGDRPWSEGDSVAPLNAYGLSKSIGEAAILRSGCRAYIFRTSWVYGVHGKNFMKTMLRLGKTRQSIGVVADQFGAPTSAEFIADISTWVATHRPPKGVEIVHLVPNGVTTWFGFAKEIFEQVKLEDKSIKEIIPLSTKEYPTPAKRPANSRLLNSRLSGLMPQGVIKGWQFYVQRVLSEILAN